MSVLTCLVRHALCMRKHSMTGHHCRGILTAEAPLHGAGWVTVGRHHMPQRHHVDCGRAGHSVRPVVPCTLQPSRGAHPTARPVGAGPPSLPLTRTPHTQLCLTHIYSSHTAAPHTRLFLTHSCASHTAMPHPNPHIHIHTHLSLAPRSSEHGHGQGHAAVAQCLRSGDAVHHWGYVLRQLCCMPCCLKGWLHSCACCS